jgi:hypothetical protein
VKFIFVAFFEKRTQRECDAKKALYEFFIKIREIKKNLQVFMKL